MNLVDLQSKDLPKYFIGASGYLCLLFFSLIPQDTTPLTVLPKEGDDFKSPSTGTIYHYKQAQKHSYPNARCYFSYGNPPFGTSYKNGGLKIIDESIIHQIPTGNRMCSSSTELDPKINFPSHIPDIDVLLFHYSSWGHFIGYFLWGLVLLFILKKYVYTIVITFLGGGIIELLQYFVPGRTPSFTDLLLNSLGVLCAIGVFYSITLLKNKQHVT